MKNDNGGYEIVAADSIEIFRNNREKITIKDMDKQPGDGLLTISVNDVPMICRIMKKIASEINASRNAEINS